MTPHVPDSTLVAQAMELITNIGIEGLPRAFEILFNEAMKVERSEFLQAAPRERTETRQGWANGFKPKKVKTRIGELDLDIPQVRNLPEGTDPFYPRSLERGLRSERALKLSIAEMYVQGVSTRRVIEITRELCGLDISSSQVSRATQELDEELKAWRERSLGEFRYLFLDARYEKVRHGGSVVDCALLIAVGVDTQGHRSILGTSVSLSEAEVHWRSFLESLQGRGLHGVHLVVSDDHAGLKAALASRMPGTSWQRCQFHLQQNAQSYVPRQDMKKEVADDIRSVFHARDRQEADRLKRLIVEKYSESAPRLAAWMDENLDEGLTVFELPVHHRRSLRTNNLAENLNKQIKRRTRVASIFPNEASLLRLATAIVAEQSEEWETNRRYLNMENN